MLTVGSLVHPCNQKRHVAHRIGVVVRVSIEQVMDPVLYGKRTERCFDVLLSDGTLLLKRTWKGLESQHRVLEGP